MMKSTTFPPSLPASVKAAEIAEPVIPRCCMGCGRILVMDDERYLLDVIALALEEMGYDVVTAEDGEQAIERMRSAIAARQPFAAAILDLTIPGGRGGRETVRVLRKMDPEIKVIASSGYAEDPVMSDPSRHGFATRLIKPYRIDDLRRTLESILDCSSATAGR